MPDPDRAAGSYHGRSDERLEEHGITEPTPSAFLLLKPDCLRRGRSRAVERAVAAEGLRVERRFRLRLTGTDVRHLWSEYTEEGNVLSRALLDRYLCVDPSEVLLLRGPDAFEAARRIKRSIRARYAAGPYANVLHAAETPDELARQLDHLTGDCACTPAAPRPAGIDFRRVWDVPRLVERLWPALQDDPPPPAPHRLGRWAPAAVVHAAVGRDHSLDSAVTALWHALPGVAPAHAVQLAMHAARAGWRPIAVGGPRAADRCRRALVEHGVSAEIEWLSRPRSGSVRLDCGRAAPARTR